jgi:hypothetical protein
MSDKKHKPTTYYEASENLRSELRGLGNAILDAGLGRIMTVAGNAVTFFIALIKFRRKTNHGL